MWRIVVNHLVKSLKSFPLFSLLKESSCSNSTACELRLKEDSLQSLRRIKREKGSKADMWCHFGKVVIHRPDEGKLIDCNMSQKTITVLSFYEY